MPVFYPPPVSHGYTDAFAKSGGQDIVFGSWSLHPSKNVWTTGKNRWKLSPLVLEFVTGFIR